MMENEKTFTKVVQVIGVGAPYDFKSADGRDIKGFKINYAIMGREGSMGMQTNALSLDLELYEQFKTIKSFPSKVEISFIVPSFTMLPKVTGAKVLL